MEYSLVEPIANSSILSLAKNSASSLYIRSITVALYTLLKSRSIFEAQVAGFPASQIASLIPTTAPAKGPAVPSLILASIRSALSNAPSISRWVTALISVLFFSMVDRCSATKSRIRSSPLAMRF